MRSGPPRPRRAVVVVDRLPALRPGRRGRLARRRRLRAGVHHRELGRPCPRRCCPRSPPWWGGGGPPRATLGSFDPAMLVHGEQSIELFGPIPPDGAVRTTSEVTGIYDKGSGALVVSRSTSVDATPASRVSPPPRRCSSGARGASAVTGARRRLCAMPDAPTRRRGDLQHAADQALLYRLSGDRNPLHSDPVFAKRAGFDRPILHGLCTYGFTGRALLHAVCGSDPARFRSMAGRFSRPTYPGDTLTISIWADGDARVVPHRQPAGRDRHRRRALRHGLGAVSRPGTPGASDVRRSAAGGAPGPLDPGAGLVEQRSHEPCRSSPGRSARLMRTRARRLRPRRRRAGRHHGVTAHGGVARLGHVGGQPGDPGPGAAVARGTSLAPDSASSTRRRRSLGSGPSARRRAAMTAAVGGGVLLAQRRQRVADRQASVTMSARRWHLAPRQAGRHGAQGRRDGHTRAAAAPPPARVGAASVSRKRARAVAENGSPSSAASDGRAWRGSREADDVAVLVDVDALGGGVRRQARHGAHVAADRVDETRTHRGPHLAHRQAPARRCALAGWGPTRSTGASWRCRSATSPNPLRLVAVELAGRRRASSRRRRRRRPSWRRSRSSPAADASSG